MIKEYPASTYEYWHKQWISGNVMTVVGDNKKVLVKHKTMITTHTKLLNALIEKYNLKSYLEIGVQNPANNFDKIIVPYKVGVDPELTSVLRPGIVCEESTDKNEVGDYLNYYEINGCTSDDFFASRNIAWDGGPRRAYSLIFIDGLHHADQVKRDFENSLRCLSDNGFIVTHDVLPENEAGTKVPRETKMWWGDVYKWAMEINKYRDIKWITYNIDNGCMVIQKSKPGYSLINDPEIEPNWSNYLQHGIRLMNVQDEVII